MLCGRVIRNIYGLIKILIGCADRFCTEIILMEMSDIKEVVIVTDGKKSSRFQYLELIRKSKFLICTDGAIKWLLKHNLEPDVVIGDLDSIESSVPLSSFVEYDGNQENSDLEKAILYENMGKFGIVLFAVGKRKYVVQKSNKQKICHRRICNFHPKNKLTRKKNPILPSPN